MEKNFQLTRPTTRGEREGGETRNDELEALRQSIEAQDLPVRRRLQEVVDALVQANNGNRMLVLEGATGSGKSVYTPIAMRDALKQSGESTRVRMMQPRRDAASGIARAVAAVTHNRLGEGVGYATSEAKEIDLQTPMGVVTSGIFLRYLMEGRLTKEQVGGLIIDEVHEGSLDYHLVLGMLKMLHEKGEAPLTLFTSATLDHKRLSEFFGISEEQFLRIEGRAHPIDIEYQNANEQQKPYITQAANKARALALENQTEGDILVFMPGQKEIKATIQQIGFLPNVEVLPLYGDLSPQEREKVVLNKNRKEKVRRIIVATNIAETSVTVPGITAVIDSCRQRSVAYNPRTGIVEKGTGMISKDQAQQRAGRAGRIQPGQCYRMLTQEAYDRLEQHPTSEISRSNLSQVVLKIMQFGMDPKEFPFIEPPKPEAITYAIQELQLLGAVSEDGQLTDIGQDMVQMPFEPRISRMLVEAKQRNCVESALVLAAFSREQHVLLHGRDATEKSAAKTAHKKFARGNSDLLTNIAIFQEAINQGVFEASLDRRDQSDRERNIAKSFYHWCEQNHLNGKALTHIAYKLFDYAHYANTAIHPATLSEQLQNAKPQDVGAVILSGQTDRLFYALNNSRGMAEYRLLGGEGKVINISPGSQAVDTNPKVFIALQVSEGQGTKRGTEITRNYASEVHPVTVAEIRAVAPHLITETRYTPQYNPSTDTVTSEVYVQLQGRVSFGSERVEVIDSSAVEAFAQALTDAKVDMPCVAHNKQVLDALNQLFHRSRGGIKKPDMKEWYKEHLQGVYCKKDAIAQDQNLFLQIDDFYSPEQRAQVDKESPTQVVIKGHTIPVTYSFTPSGKDYYGTEIPENFSATLFIDPEYIFDMQQEDIPFLGPDDAKVQPKIQTKKDYFNTITSFNIDELKDSIDTQRIQQAWETWKEKPQPQPIEISVLQPLPQVASIGHTPKEYTRTWKGESVYAYPAITTKKTYDYGKSAYVFSYSIEYCPNQTEAESQQKETEKHKFQLDAQEQGRIDRVTLMEPAQQALEELEQRIQTIQNVPAEYGFDNITLYKIQQQLVDAKMAMSTTDHWRAEKDPDPRKALKICKEIEQELNKKANSIEKRKQQLPDILALRDAIESQINLILNYSSYEEYGLTYDAYNNLYSKWNEACQLINTVNGDIDRAQSLLQELQTAMAAAVQYKNKGFSLSNPSVGFGSFADAFSSSTERKISPNTVPAQEKPLAPKPEKEEEPPMTEEQKAQFADDMIYIQSLIEYVSQLGSKPREQKLPRDKALGRVYDRLSNLRQQIITIEQKLQSTEPQRASVIKSQIGQVRTDIEKVLQNNSSDIVGNGYDNQWIQRYKELWAGIDAVISQHSDAQEFIHSGLITQDELRSRMRAALKKELPQIVRGTVMNMSEICDDILSDI